MKQRTYLNKILFFLFSTFSVVTTLAQEFSRDDIDFDAYVDDMFQLQDEGVNYELLYENLILYFENPINLNRADYEELSTLLVLSDDQKKNLLNHIKKNGKLLSIYELQSIEGFEDLSTIYSVLPVMSVDDVVMNIDNSPLWKRMLTEDNNSLIIRTERTLEAQKGYNPVPKEDGTLPSHYLGSPWKQYLRYRVSHKNDFSLGFLAEKDKGEEFIWDPATKRYGMDFYSFHFHTYNKGRFKKIAIGDYQIQEGQSLVFAGGFLIGKSPETVNSVRRTSVGVRPYTSAIEGGFFRGAAATYQISDRLDVTVMGSRKNIDVTVNELEIDTSIIGGDTLFIDNSTGEFIPQDQEALDELGVSFQGGAGLQGSTGGFHRTASELRRKHTVTEYNSGGNITYKSKDKNLEIGFNALYTHLSDSIAKQPIVRNIYEFRGDRNLIYGTNYSYNWRNFNFFGEVAQSQSGGIGAVQGIVGSLSRKLQVALHLRSFDSDFHTLYGDAFSESGSKNERGIYYGMKYKFNPKWELSAYYDKFSYPWMRFQLEKTRGYGDEYLARLHYKPKRGIAMYFQHKNETKLRNLFDNETRVDIAVPTTRQTQIFNIDINNHSKISLKSRVQWSYFQQAENPREFGYMVFQDVNVKFSKFRISTRYAIFDTETSDDPFAEFTGSSNNNRQYTYEKDVLYAYSIYSFAGIGTRKYILLRYTPFRRLDFWVKLSRTSFDEKPGYVVGSGLEQINGSNRTDLRMQMRYKF